jgi:hypothetical protein
MRNLKKILSLALALVMTLSVMSVASATTYSDSSKITAKYAEAVDVLSGLGVFEGDDEGFRPQDNISRAEVAAIIYRVATGDVAGTNKGLYADYNKFTDVPAGKWYSGYVNYCANAVYIKGIGNNEFDPDGDVTGYAVLAMILRVVGYDQNEEWTGTGWETKVASTARELGITDTVSEVTLGKAVTREVVAELLFRTLVKANTVTYTLAAGYSQYDRLVGGNPNPTLGVKIFGLRHTGIVSVDSWGRPGYYWYTDKSGTVGRTATNTVATEAATADATYTVATTECDIAHDLGLTGHNDFTVYTNGDETTNNVRSYDVYALDTVNKVGAQGTLTEVYDYSVTWVDTGVTASTDRIVVIDTFLAQVVAVADATYDANNHLKTESKITLAVYTTPNNTSLGTAEYVYQETGSTNYTYTVGQMILVNAYTNNALSTHDLQGAIATNAILPAAVTNGQVTTKSSLANAVEATNIVLVGAAQTLTGAQTVIWYNASQHTVNGTTYNDSKWFDLDQAGTDITNHTWYFDSYGNLIGATDIATQYTYGVITSIWWVNDASNGSGYANATITYMDGTSATVKLSSVDIDGIGTTTSDYPAYTLVGGEATDAMTIRTASDHYTNLNGTVGTGGTSGEISVANNAYINASNTAASAGTNPATIHTKGYNVSELVLSTHLYRFETLANGSVAAALVTQHTASAVITTGVPSVKDSSNQQVCYIDSNTVFLVRNGSGTGATWTSITGYNNIYTYDNNSNGDGSSYATIDVVPNATGNAAKYVYVTGTPANNTASEFVYSNGNNYNATLLTDANGVSYYQFTYGVSQNGTTNVMKVAGTTAAYNAVIVPLINGTGRLFKITYTNGLATSADDVTSGTQSTSTQTAKYLGVDVTAANDVLYDTDGTPASFNVTSSTVVIGGTLADLATAGKNVYVIYNTPASGQPNYVTHIYISDALGTNTNTITGALAVVNGMSFTAYTTEDGTSSDTSATTDEIKRQINAALTAAGINVITTINVTEADTDSLQLKAVGAASHNATFTVTVSDGTTTSSASSQKTMSVTNNYTLASLKTAISTAISSVTIHANDDVTAAKAHITDALNTANISLTNQYIELVSGTPGTANNVLTWTVTGTDANLGSISVTEQVSVASGNHS